MHATTESAVDPGNRVPASTAGIEVRAIFGDDIMAALQGGGVSATGQAIGRHLRLASRGSTRMDRAARDHVKREPHRRKKAAHEVRPRIHSK